MSEKTLHYFCHICNEHLKGKEELLRHKEEKTAAHKTFLEANGGKLRTHIVNMPAPEVVRRPKKKETKKMDKRTKKSTKKSTKAWKVNQGKKQHKNQQVLVPDVRDWYPFSYPDVRGVMPRQVTPVWEYEPTIYEPMVIVQPSGPQPRCVYLAGF